VKQLKENMMMKLSEKLTESVKKEIVQLKKSDKVKSI